MANNSSKNTAYDTSSSWDAFKMPAGGSASDIRKSVAQLRSTVSQEKIAFAGVYSQPLAAKSKR